MPGISHLVFGLMLVIPFMLFAREKFNYKVATIFVLSNWVGPDSYWAWRFIGGDNFDLHALLPFLIWAIPLSLFYSYLSRFSFTKTERFFMIVDDGRREVSLKNAYILCVAGAAFHNFIDTLFHGGFPIDLFPEGSPYNIDLAWIGKWGEYMIPQGADILIIVGFISMIVTSLLIVHFLSRSLKDLLIFLGVIVGFIIFTQIVLGWSTFTERELSATTYTLFFIFLPLLTFAYVMNDVNKNPTKPSTQFISSESVLKLIAVVSLILAGGFLFLGLSPLFAPSIVNSLLGGYLGPSELLIIGLVVSVIAGIGVIGAVGLFFKNKICRNIIIFVSVLLWFFVFPFAIALVLSRSDIKNLFEKESSE
ncbi:MAG: hypothetical protein HWN66_08065 [Candidatus Helarchaeota archaeon]|nr:hypothetical protein [Candidatus Helarchaeota archaeon]